MKAENIKHLLHESIENINDEALLKAVKQILDTEYKTSVQPKLSKGQIKRMDEAKEQIRQGNFLTNQQADKLVEKWLKQ